MHINRVDLNLFVVFEAIYTEASVSEAARKLNLSQPAISHALNRLRQLLGDPLFVRQAQSMAPTPLARGMIDPVRLALRGLQLTLNQHDRFDAASSAKQFTLALRDVLAPTVLAPLMACVCALAPKVDLAAIQVERRELEGELAAGTLDCAIDVLLPLGSAIRRARMGHDTYVVLAREHHPLLQSDLTLARYLALEHVLVSSRRRGQAPEDFELSRHGWQRRVRLRCQHYLAACRVVSQTDLLLTMPEAYARLINAQFGNQILPFPLEMPALDVFLYWHENVDNDPANVWLRQQIMTLMQTPPALVND